MCVSVYLCVCMYKNMCPCVYTYEWLGGRGGVSLSVCYVCVSVYKSVCVCLCVSVRMCVCI